MNWMMWKAFMPPAVLPLAVSMLVALAGPGGPLGLTPQHSAEQLGFGADSNSSGDGGSDGGHIPPLVGATPAPSPEQTPAPTPSTFVSAVPTPTTPTTPPSPPLLPPPPPPEPDPPPVSTPTPAPTPPAPTITSDEACARVRVHIVANMETVTVTFKSCSAQRLGTAWGVTWKIRDPACGLQRTGQVECADEGINLKFYLYEQSGSIAAADAATALVLQTY